MRHRLAVGLLFAVATGNTVLAATQDGLTTESFDNDPGWDGFNNRVAPKKIPTVIQDFGYSPTHT